MSMNMALMVLLTKIIVRLYNTALCRNISSTTFFFFGGHHETHLGNPQGLRRHHAGVLGTESLGAEACCSAGRTHARVGQRAAHPSWCLQLPRPASPLHGGHRPRHRDILASGLQQRRSADPCGQQQKQRRDAPVGSPSPGSMTTNPRPIMVRGFIFNFGN